MESPRRNWTQTLITCMIGSIEYASCMYTWHVYLELKFWLFANEEIAFSCNPSMQTRCVVNSHCEVYLARSS